MTTERTMSIVNRVRLTAWAWLAAAFLLGTTTGVVAAGVPLWKQLQSARDDAARLEQVDWLTRRAAPGADVDALVSLEDPSQAPSKRAAAATSVDLEAAPILAQHVAPEPVAKVQAPPADDAALAAAQQEFEKRKAAEARRITQVAEEAERRAKAERQARLDREAEQKLAKAAQEANQRKELERRQAEARAAATRAKPQIDAPAPVAAQVPASATNGPTERVTKDEAGLSDVQAGAVTFKSGRRVAVGDSFPSGEKLISVDPRIGEIITSKRRIVIKGAMGSSDPG